MQDKDTQYFDPGPPGYCWLTGYRFTNNHGAETSDQRRRRQLKDAARKREKKEKQQLQTQTRLKTKNFRA